MGGEPEFCVCLDSVFPGLSDAALRRIADLAVTRFEFWDWRERDVDALALESSRRGLQAVIFSGNTFAEPLVDPRMHGRAMAHLTRSLRVAGRLGTRLLVMHVGYAMPQRNRAEQWRAVVRGLQMAGGVAASSGVTLAVEPLNSRYDHPGYFLDTLADAIRLLDEVGHSAVRLLVDVYHMQVMHNNLLKRLPEVLPQTAHVHLADVPGRGEPGSGTIHWPAVMRILRDGYEGAIGLECWPTTAPEEALRHCMEVLRA